jgi:hypothetical protein
MSSISQIISCDFDIIKSDAQFAVYAATQGMKPIRSHSNGCECPNSFFSLGLPRYQAIIFSNSAFAFV